MRKTKETQEMLFETSWEVCNKVGGIYAVLSTKAKTLQDLYKGNVIFIGPDFWSKDNESPFFKETKSLMADWKKSAVLPEGLNVRIGRWLIPGRPVAVLIDFKSMFQYKDSLYAEMWDKYHVDSLHAYGDYDESCMFAYASALVIESIVKFNKDKNLRAIAHFDEWTTGMGLLYLKAHAPEVATVFTTHATSIGRSICGNGKPLYDYMEGYNGDQMAGELNMQSKHSLEKTAAHEADAFTTVSEVTARECRQLLEINPFVTPNAFEQNFVPKGAKYKAARKAARQRLLEVATALTGETYADDTLLVATSGRSEFRNKGLDVFIDAVNVVRNEERGKNRKIVVFITVPAWVDVPRTDLQDALKNGSKQRLENAIITHTLHDYAGDCVYGKLNYLGIHNEECDNVKVIYVPSYLNGTDGIINMSYYDILAGFDCTVFGSYYEPWGYTPLESVAFGVPTITTDLAGFGQWVLDTYGNDGSKSGVRVIHRTDSNYSEVVRHIADGIENIYNMEEGKISELRTAAENTANEASWENFMKYYEVAYKAAFENAEKRNAKK